MIQKKKFSLSGRVYSCLAIAALCTFFNVATQAQQIGTYKVINVRAGSALNVRAEHSSKSQDIGSASLGTPLQVVDFSPNGGWAKVKWEQSFGWVSVRFLSPVDTFETKTPSTEPPSSDIAALVALQKAQEQPAFSEQELALAAVENDTVIASSTASVPETAALSDSGGSQFPSIFCTGNGPNWQLSLNRQGSLVFNAPDDNSLYATTQWRQSISNKSTYAFAVSKIRGTLLHRACLDKRSNTSMEWQLELHTNGFGGQDQLSGCCSSSQ